ncbi:hypothetical protein QVD17_19764 [Tagetes erecta]|uniref:Uncharacterized protein n=1 Tax=Tagetes erecta TaxID=13708 RepID=A0AAD8KRI1_TARER|nr:hypothetical protein QVD17_19764 [Tagetes erecta]
MKIKQLCLSEDGRYKTMEKIESTKNKFDFSNAPKFDLQIPDLTPRTKEGQETNVVEEETMSREKENEEYTMKKGSENRTVFKEGGLENPNAEKETEEVLINKEGKSN